MAGGQALLQRQLRKAVMIAMSRIKIIEPVIDKKIHHPVNLSCVDFAVLRGRRIAPKPNRFLISGNTCAIKPLFQHKSHCFSADRDSSFRLFPESVQNVPARINYRSVLIREDIEDIIQTFIREPGLTAGLNVNQN